MRRRRQHGGTLVESTLVLMVMLTLMFSIFDLGYVMFRASHPAEPGPCGSPLWLHQSLRSHCYPQRGHVRPTGARTRERLLQPEVLDGGGAAAQQLDARRPHYNYDLRLSLHADHAVSGRELHRPANRHHDSRGDSVRRCIHARGSSAPPAVLTFCSTAAPRQACHRFETSRLPPRVPPYSRKMCGRPIRPAA